MRAGPLADPGHGFRREELGDGSLELAAGLDRQVGESLRAEPLRSLGQLVDLAARGATHARSNDRLDPAARRERLVEHAEPRATLERRREVDQLHAEADVRLVGAEPLDDLVVGEHRERHLQDRPLGCRRLADLDGNQLDEAHDRGFVHEAHLEVELGELRLAVAAQVLVAVAARDLEVAVEPGDHQQLLELLRALRKRVDAARLETRRDDEVAGALRRALDQRRRLDLDEPMRVVDLADRLDHPAAQQESPLHRLAPDVEVAVLEANALVDRGVGLVDVERRGPGLGQDLDRVRPELDLARGELRVLRVRAAARATSPEALTTNSERIREATAWASGESVASTTTWVIPCRSRRSRKMSWPWSRRRWTQPDRRALMPASAARSWPQV